jgi:hypothetical protein
MGSDVCTYASVGWVGLCLSSNSAPFYFRLDLFERHRERCYRLLTLLTAITLVESR